MSTLGLVTDAKALLDQRGVIGAGVVASTSLVQISYSMPQWKSWERPDLLAGLLVVSFCAAHGFYEGLLGHLQGLLLERATLTAMRERLDDCDQARLKTVHDMRSFREALFAYAPTRVQRRIESHENARRNSLYLATSSAGAIALTCVLAFVDSRIGLLPWRLYLVLAVLAMLSGYAARYRSRVLGRDLGYAYTSDVDNARRSIPGGAHGLDADGRDVCQKRGMSEAAFVAGEKAGGE